MDHSVDYELAGWSHSKSCSHWLSVHMEINDECCSSGLHRDHHYLTSLLVTWTVGSWAPPAHLLMTRNCVVWSCTGGKEGASRGTRTEDWDCASLMEFSRTKSKVLHQGWGNPSTNTDWPENVSKAALGRRTWGRLWTKSSV